MTLANQVTIARFFMSIAFFVLLGFCDMEHPAPPKALTVLWVANGLYIATALGDLLDGYLARKRGEVTDFGRIADPLVDKICVVGSFAYFLTFDALRPIIEPWMVIVIMARELLVVGVRSALEAKGIPFGADAWGKQKAFLQNLAVIFSLAYCAQAAPTNLMTSGLRALMWVTLLSTTLSGLSYMVAARRIWKMDKA